MQEQQTGHRGRMVRSDRQMPDQGARAYLREHCVAHVGTSDASGWPYVVPLIYVHEAGNLFYLHTGPHQGHFLANVRENPRICIQLDESEPLASQSADSVRLVACLSERYRVRQLPRHARSRFKSKERVVFRSATGSAEGFPVQLREILSAGHRPHSSL
jgi:hypothetical protein